MTAAQAPGGGAPVRSLLQAAPRPADDPRSRPALNLTLAEFWVYDLFLTRAENGQRPPSPDEVFHLTGVPNAAEVIESLRAKGLLTTIGGSHARTE